MTELELAIEYTTKFIVDSIKEFNAKRIEEEKSGDETKDASVGDVSDMIEKSTDEVLKVFPVLKEFKEKIKNIASEKANLVLRIENAMLRLKINDQFDNLDQKINLE